MKHNMKKLYLIGVVSLLLSLSLFAEGTKQAAPNSPGNPADTLVMLEINNPNFGSFAAFNGPEESRMYFRIQNITEKVYFGLAAAVDANGLEFSNDLTASYSFQIRKLNTSGGENPIVHGPFVIGKNNANLNSYGQAEFPNYSTSATSNGQLIYFFDPSANIDYGAGDYFIEFLRTQPNPDDEGFEDRLFIPYWDVTVTNATDVPIPGRLYSRNWAFRTPTIIGDSYPDCGWDREYQGIVYTYTNDGFVTQLDFSNSGFQGLSFNIAINSSGPGNTGNLLEDRKSREGNETQTASEFLIFLNPPCEVCFPSGECAEVISNGNFVPDPNGVYCLEVTSTSPGQMEIILDFNSNGVYEPQLQDLLLVYEFFKSDFDANNGNPVTACIPWDGIKADGTGINYQDTMQVILTYQQGLQHYSGYDVEFVKNGFCVETVRPINCSGEPSNFLYWDDSDLVNITNPGTGQPLSLLEGCECGINNCRTWTQFDSDITTPQNDCGLIDENTLGYGDKSTLNTWWVANLQRIFIQDLPLHTCAVTAPSSVICEGEVTVLTANVSTLFTEGLTYSWSGPAGYAGSTGPTSGPVSLPGLYQVVVTDIEGLTTTCDFFLTVLEAPSLECSPFPVTCPGELTGQILVSASGGSGEGYEFSLDGENYTASSVFSNLPSGEYTVFVRDGVGCTNTCEVVIEEPIPISITLISATPPSCNNFADGTASISIAGGTPPFTYLWNSGSVSSSPTNLTGGINTVTITDNAQCTEVFSIQLAEPPQLSVFTQIIKPVTCFDDNDGSISALGSGGTPPYNFLWDNGETTATATRLSLGIHTVTITDFNGCAAIATDTILGPESPLSCFVLELSPVSYPGQQDGVASAFPSGGWSGYSYLWSNGSTNKQANNLTAGLHSVTVTDAFGCETVCSIVVSEIPPIECNVFESQPISCNGGADGRATVEAIGGNGELSYRWSNGNTGRTAINLSADIAYTVTITDEEGYSETCSIILSDPPSLPCNLEVLSAVSCFGNNDGIARANVPNTGGPYTFLWDNGDTRQTADSLRAGTRFVTITDGEGCPTVCFINVTQPLLRIECPDNLTLDCDDPANEGLIEAWLTDATLTGACENLEISTNYNPDNFSVNGCNLTQTVVFFTQDPVGLTTASCFSRIFITDNQPPNIICPPDTLIACDSDLPRIDFLGGQVNDDCSLFIPNFSQEGNPSDELIGGICDEGIDGCITVTFLGKTTIGSAQVELSFEVVNNCDANIRYVSFQLPSKTAAIYPEHNSLYEGTLGDYTVENPTSQFLHFLRFNPLSKFFSRGKTETFQYTLPVNKVPDELVVLVRTNQDYYHVKLSSSCTSNKTSLSQKLNTDGIIVQWVSDVSNNESGCAPFNIIYTRTYTATDACGNESLPCTQEIIVESDASPPILLHDYPGIENVNHLDTVYIDCPLLEPPLPQTAVRAIDGCTNPRIEFSEVVIDQATGNACDEKGYEKLLLCTWKAYDECNYEAEYSFYMAIVDREAPEFHPIPTPELIGTCSNIPPAPVISASDNCSSMEVNFTENIVYDECDNVRLIRIWSATDACGNRADVSQTVFLIDDSAPSIAFDHPELRYVENGAELLVDCDQASLLIIDNSYATTTDICDPNPTFEKTVEQIGNLESCNLDELDYKITWTATDNCNNVSTFVIYLNIFDNEKPTLVNVPDDICTTVLPPVPTNVFATDGCDNNPVVSFTESNPIPIGGSSTVTRTWTAEDQCGNKVSAKQVITLNPSLTSFIQVPTTAVICGSNNNALTALAAGGISPYSFQWSVTQGNAVINSNRNASEISFSAGTGTSLFELEVTDNRGCTDYVYQFIQCTNPSIIQPIPQTQRAGQQLLWKIYPNPASKKAFLTFNPQSKEPFVMKIYNNEGQLVHTKQYDNSPSSTVELNLNQWENGIYNVSLYNKAGALIETQILLVNAY